MTLWTVQVLFPCLDEVITTDNDDPSETILVSTQRTLDISSPGVKPSFTKRTKPRAGRNTPNRLWRKPLSPQFLLKCWLNHDQGVSMVSQGVTIAGSMTTMRFNRLKCPRKISSLWLLWEKSLLSGFTSNRACCWPPPPRASPLANASDCLGYRTTEVGVLNTWLSYMTSASETPQCWNHLKTAPPKWAQYNS